MKHIVTEGLLQDHLNCQSKSYLRLHGRQAKSLITPLCVPEWMLATSLARYSGWRLNRRLAASVDLADRVLRIW
jgi:hypothetical protein